MVPPVAAMVSSATIISTANRVSVVKQVPEVIFRVLIYSTATSRTRVQCTLSVNVEPNCPYLHCGVMRWKRLGEETPDGYQNCGRRPQFSKVIRMSYVNSFRADRAWGYRQWPEVNDTEGSFLSHTAETGGSCGDVIARGKEPTVAFTLIELLVVIVIIATIAAISFPVFNWAREKARQATCLSNLHQLGSASLIYAQDYDGYLPPYINQWTLPSPQPINIGYSAPNLLISSLSPYIKNRAVWFCPDDPYAGINVEKWGVTHLYSSYYFHFMAFPYLTIEGENLYSIVIHPSPFRVLGWSPSRYQLIRDSHAYGNPYPPYIINCPSPGGDHFGGVNIFYLDGHARWKNRCW